MSFRFLPRPWSKALLFLCASLALVASSFARINVSPSIEWLADQSDLIGIFTVVEVKITHEPGPENWGTATVEMNLIDQKKGTLPAKLTADYALHFTDAKGVPSPEIAKGHRLLCFLRNDAAEPQGKVVYLVDLDAPTSHGPHTPFAADFTMLPTREAILARLDGRLKRGPAAKIADPRKFWVEIPGDKPAHAVLYGGSTCYLIIPADLRPKK